MVDSVLFSSTNDSVSDMSSLSFLNVQSCARAAEQYYFWMFVLLIFPAIINCFSLAISFITIVHVRRLKSVTEAVTSSIHWLARTANRVGLGISAHNALMEYAKKKNLIKLIPNIEQRNNNLNLRRPRITTTTTTTADGQLWISA